MQLFNNLSLKSKFIGGFCLIIILVAAFAVFVIKGISSIENQTVKLDVVSQELYYAKDLQLHVANIWQFITDASLTKEKESIDKEAKQNQDSANANLDKLIQLAGNNSDRLAKLDKIKASLPVMYETGIKMYYAYLKNWDQGNIIMTDYDKASDAVIGSVYEIVNDSKDNETKTEKKIFEIESSTRVFTLFVSVVVIALIILIGLIVILKMIVPIKVLSQIARKVSVGDVEVEFNKTANDEIGFLTKTFIAIVETTKKQINVAEKIANGELNVEVEIRSEKDELSKSFIKVLRNLNELVADSNRLSKSAVEGRLEVRGDSHKFKGGYKDIINGVNATLDAVIHPLNVAAEYVERISKGDLSEIITENYNGDFNSIKININTCIASLKGLIGEMNNMSTQHDKGDIDVTINANKFDGAYKEMAEGVNTMVNNHIGMNKKAMACIAEFGKGNFNAELEKFPGKKAFINNTIEQVRTNLKSLITDTDMLVNSAVKGSLSARADSAKHQGDFKKIVEGINATLDAVIHPLNVAAEYVERISKGDLPELITENYNGDFNSIKNNLNTCINSLKGLIGEMNNMSSQHDKGDTDVMIDIAKFDGAYKAMASGVNEMVSNHISMNKKAMACIAEFGKGNFNATLEKFPGKKSFYKRDNRAG